MRKNVRLGKVKQVNIPLRKIEVDLINWYIRHHDIKNYNKQLVGDYSFCMGLLKEFIEEEIIPECDNEELKYRYENEF